MQGKVFMSILSIQSHVSYGYVGNKAATFPLQCMGYDVHPINTVQFSNHTGYGQWTGDIFSGAHILSLVNGLDQQEVLKNCRAVLSGYMGSSEICDAVYQSVRKVKEKNSKALYLCDPVMGSQSCFVKPEVVDFFKNKLEADIVTPNPFEVELLTQIKITNLYLLKSACDQLHSRNISLVVVTGCILPELGKGLHTVISDQKNLYSVMNQEYQFPVAPNGTGDLFSSLFLGEYLKKSDAVLATQFAVYYLDLILKNTLTSGKRELQVISSLYPEVPWSKLPLVNVIKF